jgi:hypothetical protein
LYISEQFVFVQKEILSQELKCAQPSTSHRFLQVFLRNLVQFPVKFPDSRVSDDLPAGEPLSGKNSSDFAIFLQLELLNNRDQEA